MSATESTDDEKDYECILFVFAVWERVMCASTAADKLKARGCLTGNGTAILEAIHRAGLVRGAYQLNIDKIMIDVCGWDTVRGKLAIAKAKALGFVDGGPRPN